jgi:hypothetical protein
MKLKFVSASLTICSLVLCCISGNPEIRFSGWDMQYMKEVKKSLNSGSSVLLPAYKRLISDADKELTRGPYSVTFKNTTPPGGTKHDYMSQGPYWWPDTAKPDGLPYIRLDGVVNPESGIDRVQIGNLFSAVRTLSLAWYFSGELKYAAKAEELLKVWFIDPETRMNPNLEYAQAIPGVTTGRGIGIIDVRGLYSMTDAMALLETSGAMPSDEIIRIRSWFTDFFKWLTTSKNGKDEDNYFNNHAVAYDVIVTSIARFLDNDEYVVKKTGEIPGRRIDPMIKADGRQPEELIRTKAFGYSVANLRNFFDAGETGLKVNVNIFGYTNPEGGSLQKALDFLISYIGKKEEWKWQQITEWESTEDGLGLLIRRAARYYNDPNYKEIWEKDFADRLKSDWNLLVTPGL